MSFVLLLVKMGWCEEWKPIFVMLAVEVAYAAMNTMIKTAIDEGMNRLILITLRQLIATLFMAPVAYFRERYRGYCILFHTISKGL